MTDQPVLQDGDVLKNISVADSTGSKAGTPGASKEAGGHSRGGLTPASTPAAGVTGTKPAPDAMRKALEPFIKVAKVMEFYTPESLPDMTFPRADCESKYPDEPRCVTLTTEDFARLAALSLAPVLSGDGADTMDEYEKRIREKVFNSGILTSGEWVYLVGLFQLSRDHDHPSDAGAAEPVANEIQSSDGGVESQTRKELSADAQSLIAAGNVDSLGVAPGPSDLIYAVPPVRGGREAIAKALFARRYQMGASDVDSMFQWYADDPKGTDRSRMAIYSAFMDADVVLSLPSAPVSDKP